MRTTLWSYRPLALSIVLLTAAAAHALTLQELQNDSRLTPERFARDFASFQFEYSAAVQAPETFLARQSGDCDDYATLAAQVLSGKGYTTRLMAVRMKGAVHVVCYVEQSHAYLDYNCRNHSRPLVASANSLSAIADSVSRSFGRRWTSVSEFTYCGHGVKRLVKTVMAREVHHSWLFGKIGF